MENSSRTRLNKSVKTFAMILAFARLNLDGTMGNVARASRPVSNHGEVARVIDIHVIVFSIQQHSDKLAG